MFVWISPDLKCYVCAPTSHLIGNPCHLATWLEAAARAPHWRAALPDSGWLYVYLSHTEKLQACKICKIQKGYSSNTHLYTLYKLSVSLRNLLLNTAFIPEQLNSEETLWPLDPLRMQSNECRWCDDYYNHHDDYPVGFRCVGVSRSDCCV